MNVWTMNVTTYVTVVLMTICRASSFVIMHKISSVIDRTLHAPAPILTYMHGLQQSNPGSHYWVRVNPLVRSWIFATISKDLLCKVHDLMHAFDIWKRLGHRFNTLVLLVLLI